MSCGRYCAHILINVSPHQHLCCIVSLITLSCTTNLQYLPFLFIFRHSISCCQFVCTPNGTTAQPDYYRRPAKPRERESGWEIISRLSPGARKIRDLPTSKLRSWLIPENRASAFIGSSRGKGK